MFYVIPQKNSIAVETGDPVDRRETRPSFFYPHLFLNPQFNNGKCKKSTSNDGIGLILKGNMYFL